MGNIVGLNMEPWAVNQIKLRQQLLGLKQLPGGGSATTSEVLAWQNNSTPWIRAASSVDLSIEKSRELTGTGRFFGRNLAKNFVLFNGTVSLLENVPGVPSLGFNSIQRFGITNNDSVLNEYAYGLGGIEQGITPMPGIESLNITTYNRGSLRKAELKIKAHNKKQFAIIDSLYMRPGFTLLLEWGHTIYYKDTEIKNGVATKVAPQYTKSANFNTDAFRHIIAATPGNILIDQDLILSDIRAERAITNGNYDGFYGKITNFSWTYNVDGTYDITVSAISVGDVIESLNVNRVVIDDKTKPVETPKSNPKSTNSSQYLTGKASNGLEFTREFNLSEAKKYKEYWIGQGKDEATATAEAAKANGGGIPKTLTPPPNVVASEEKLQTALLDDRDRSDFNEFLYQQYNTLVTNLKSNGVPKVSVLNPKRLIQTNPLTIKTISLSLTNYNPGTDGKDLVGISTKVNLEKTSGISGENVGSVTRMSKNFPFLYIKLGSLLSYIQNNLLYYNTPKEKTDKVGTPITTFDLDGDNYCFTFPSQYSLNPNVCVIPFEILESNDTEIKENTVEALYWEAILGTSFKTTSNYAGNLFNIHVNIHHVAALLKSCTTDNSLPLLRFLEALMADIQSSLGSVNKFTVAYDHDTNKIKIYDDIPLDKNFLSSKGIKDTPESVAKFNILGLRNEGNNLFEGSFVRNIGLTTTITNALATMISIGAQAQTPSDITNATGFMKFNRGLTDAITPNKVSKVVSNQPKDDPNKVLAKAYTKLKAKGGIIFNFYTSGTTPTAEMIDSQQTSASTIFRAISSKYSTDPESDIPTQSFIPFNLNLEMDGFSGAKIYEKFTVTTDILPPGYPEALNFVIKGLGHSISNDSWTTNIESLTLAK
jgi:hypothetical protein